jgi:UDP-N-acetylmuramoyl-L-alanyl-D-glutamate--2,6-diaminopimelate ligase
MQITSLNTLLQGVVVVPSVFDVTIHGLQTDSRKVRIGDAFVALAGTSTGPEHYIDDAIRAGASVVLLESEQAGECSERSGALIVPVPELKARLGKLADRFFEYPSQRLQLIGVTGTNGKTSVTQYIAQLLQAAGTPCGLMGTLGCGMPEALQPATHTTPDVVQTNRVLAGIVANGGRAAAMEVSSHALDQGRIDRLTLTAAVFTNLTRDHLDYHGSMAAYGEAKAKLFSHEGLRFVVINVDDPFGRTLYQQLEGKCERLGFSLHESKMELWVKDFCALDNGFRAVLDGRWGEFTIEAPLMGRFNASNVLAAVATVMALGVDVTQVQQGVCRLVPPAGRLQVFTAGDGARAVVDYAHTPDALNNALAALRPHVSGRLICVFGCGGDRDSGKRPEMAQQAENGADLVIVTDDNPRTETPSAITANIMAGFIAPEKVQLIHSRAQAIAAALALAGPDDLVLVAGKGHEDYQDIAGYKHPFSDSEQVAQALKQREEVA